MNERSSTGQLGPNPSQTGQRATIRLENVHKTYDLGEIQVHALRGVSLEIHRGEFVAVMGASGSGKSTLMNTWMSEKPTKGRYYLDGDDVSGLTKRELAKSAAIRSDSCFSNSICWRAPRRLKTWSFRRSTPASRSKSARSARRRRSTAWVWPIDRSFSFAAIGRAAAASGDCASAGK